MIIYHPFEGDISSSPVIYSPKTCFIMTQLGVNICRYVTRVRSVVSRILREYEIRELDANTITTGGDYMTKIWKQVFSCPIGIAIISENLSPSTIGNIFYELALMDSYGKETLVIKTAGCTIPSDLKRTEYINVSGKYSRKIKSFINNVLKRAEYYELVAQQVEEGDPVQAIDYLRRSYLITGNNEIRECAADIYNTRNSDIDRQSRFFIKDFLRI